MFLSTSPAREVSPAPPSQQKVQKNYRLTDKCVRMMQQLATARGIAESALIEIVMREEYDRRGFKPESATTRDD